MSTMRIPIWRAFVAVGIIPSLWMILIAMALPSAWIPPNPLNARQLLEQPLYQTMPAMSIILHVQSREQFYHENGSGVAGYTRFAWLGHPECEITIPSDWVIEAWASRGYARFVDDANSSTLAHELLHCISGSWHPSWDAIEAANKNVSNYPIFIGSWPPSQEPDPRDMR
jgi:hypothetical protein